MGFGVSQIVLLSLRHSITPLVCTAGDSVCRGNMSTGAIVGGERGHRRSGLLRRIRGTKISPVTDLLLVTDRRHPTPMTGPII